MALGQQEIGERIKRARKAASLSQAELARRVGLAHPQSISNYERGQTGDISIDRLRAISEATGKPLSYFVDTPEEITPEVEEGRLDRLESQLEKVLGVVIELRDVLREERPAPPVDRAQDG